MAMRMKWAVVVGAVLMAPAAGGQAGFEVATVKATEPGVRDGRFIKMEGTNRFVARNYTVKLLIAAAYELNSKMISGGPGWVDAQHFDVAAVTPGELRPTHGQQMEMLQGLLVERFGLKFHREAKEFAIYALEPGKGGVKLQATTHAQEPVVVGPAVVYPDKVVLPGRNATVGDLASLLQRAILDRPVVDRTGLTGGYDFELTWAPDESQFGGDGPAVRADTAAPPLFVAIQQQLGLKLEAQRGMAQALIVDRVQIPIAN